jgi:hypothetical protein
MTPARMARLARSSSACPPAYGENLYSAATPVAQPANASIAPIVNVVLMGSLPARCSKVKQETMTSGNVIHPCPARLQA